MNNVISFSGGKDSTAMALLMLEKSVPIHSVVAFDTGWEFPAMHDHWREFEQKTGLKIVKLEARKSFDYWLSEHKVISRTLATKGEVTRVGNGWPSSMRRWCTREKVDTIRKYLKTVESPVSCIGFAADEEHRVYGKKMNSSIHEYRYPLIEWGIDETEALAICKRYGFEWGGLYGHFRRVSCFCCPLQRLGELRILRHHFPLEWQTMLDMDSRIPENVGFRGYASVHDLDARFADEDRQLGFDFGVATPRICNTGVVKP